MLEISQLETRARFALTGRLDTNSYPLLEDYVRSFGDDEWKDVRIDMSGCEFVSSAGLRVLIGMKKKVASRNGNMVLAGVLPDVFDVFELTGLAPLFSFE